MPCLSKTLRHHYAFSRLQIRPGSHPGRAGLPAGLLSRKSGHPRLGLTPALCPSRLIVDAEHPIGQLGHLLQVGVQGRGVEQDRGLPRGLLEGLGQRGGGELKMIGPIGAIGLNPGPSPSEPVFSEEPKSRSL